MNKRRGDSFLPRRGVTAVSMEKPSGPGAGKCWKPGHSQKDEWLGLASRQAGGNRERPGVPPHPPPSAPPPPGFRVGSVTTGGGQDMPAPGDLARPPTLGPPPGEDQSRRHEAVPPPRRLRLPFGHLDRLTSLNSDFCQVLIKRFQPSGPRAWVPFPLTGKYTFLWRRGVQVEEVASPDPAGPGGHSLLLEGALPCPEGPSCTLAHLVPDPHAARGAARRWPRRLLQWA